MTRFALVCVLRKGLDGGTPAYVDTLSIGEHVKVRPMEGARALALFFEQEAYASPGGLFEAAGSL